MIPRDYEWFYKCNCSVSFNLKENVTRKTHLVKSRWPLKRNCTSESSHPYKILRGWRREATCSPEDFWLCTTETSYSSLLLSPVRVDNLGRTHSLSSNGDNDGNKKQKSLEFVFNGAFDMQDWDDF